ncbi:hypothetical protein BDN72DRAFT_783263 [Pluteus cervinus]|uniref:Uncharacterized protein n=1 Tax=Pluteus cervinus TaxID=181527 RepID=A0ACD3BFA1_9AGAR|nr:hypothetical protein BDN72DRAFT_783263 [Pluteus cervinus]
MRPLHQRLQLYTDGSDTYIFVPSEGQGQSLTVHRSSGEIVLNKPNTSIPTSARRYSKTIYGIIGTISLSLSEYLIVSTGRELRGRLMGHEIYRAADFDILPLNPNVNVQNPPHPVEAHYLALVKSHLSGGNFLFSYTWDLSRRLQAQHHFREKDAQKAMWETADDRFFWNRFLQTRFIETAIRSTSSDFGAFILPIVYGTFDIRPAFLHGRHMQLGLISRRSRFRAGTRYFRRGVDHDGHVANFNETEQILLVEAQTSPGSMRASEDSFVAKFSFVQIRGSIPVFWGEVNTIRYKPDLQIMDSPETTDAMRRHLQEQVGIYGEQSLVNLVNQRGYEKPIKDAYERYVAEINIPNVRYQYFDFHNECKHMRWDRISILVEKLKEDLQRQGYFHVNATDPTPAKLQRGSVRTNCMDNLDRTNVVQATIAKWTLNEQLQELGILPPSGTIDDYEAFSKDFREMWADHADAIASAYGGSGALKSDFTRTNKRTRKGLLEDGVKSTVRYLKNNYFDGPRQDGFDLMTGVYVPRKSPSLSLFLITDTRPLLTRSMPLVAWFSLFMICAGFTLPRTADYSRIYFFLVWLVVLALSLIFIVKNGIDYVSWPRLLPPTEIIHYMGPGYRSGYHGMGFKGAAGPGRHHPGKSNSKWLGNKKVKVANRVEEMEMGSVSSKKRRD